MLFKDYNVWFHVSNSLTKNDMIVRSDVDIWMYGMAFFESGLLDGNKKVNHLMLNSFNSGCLQAASCAV